MEAEELFLEQLHKLHRSYPKLKIVLEHCTTKAAVEAVKACGKNVAATITAHHLDLTISEVTSRPITSRVQDNCHSGCWLQSQLLQARAEASLGSSGTPRSGGIW